MGRHLFGEVTYKFTNYKLIWKRNEILISRFTSDFICIDIINNISSYGIFLHVIPISWECDYTYLSSSNSLWIWLYVK
jgi:hypothetical protein